MFGVNSNDYVWWKCGECGHEWRTTIIQRGGKRKSGCPCCSGCVPKTGVNDLKTLYPELVREWDYSRNTGLQPECFLPGSGKKVWWKCKVCGHEWEATIHSRTKGSGCPKYRSHKVAEIL